MFLKSNKGKLLAFSLVLIASSSMAQASANSSSSTLATTTSIAYTDDSWKVEIAPYLWALSLNGSVQLRALRAHVDEPFSDILRQLNWAGMVWAEASHDKFGIFGNVLYASLSDGTSKRTVSAQVNADYGLYGGGLSYQVYKTCFSGAGCDGNFSIVPYVGFRSTATNVKLTVTTPLGNLQNTNTKYWTDPIIGARFNLNMTKSWLAIFAADIGGTNASSDTSYNLMAMLGFRPQCHLKHTSWYLGYRLLDQHYITGTGAGYYNWNMKLSGPLASISYTFG